MSSRKPHRKSRAGCLNCKRRHIKCGEERPGCRNCFEYDDIQCQYPPPKPPGGLSKNPPADSSPLALADTLNNDLDLNIADLELLHQFSTSTYKSMSNVPAEQILWQTRIIAIGLQHTFLIRGILALSAAHLAYLKPPPLALAYLVKASTHQNTAIARFRQALSTIDPSTFDAVLAFSYLIPVHSIAMAACSNMRQRMQDQDQETATASVTAVPRLQEDNLSAALKAVRLMRSVNNLILPILDTFPAGTTTLLPLLHFTKQAETLPVAPVFPGQEALDLLESACVAFASEEQHHAMTQHFRNAIEQLKTTFARVASPSAENTFFIGIVLLWTFDVSEEYVVLLGENHPCALAIWAYFSTLLHGRDLWWLEGFSAASIDIVSRKLGIEWRGVMEWPRNFVGLD